MRTRGPIRALATLAAFACAACAPRPDAVPADERPQWEVADVLLAVGEMDGDEALVFSRVAGVALLEDGAVAVADGASGTIRVFDRDGALVRISGGPGQGPGEYGWLSDLRFRPPDTLVAFDSELGRLTTLTGLGATVASTVSLRSDAGRVELYLGRFADGTHAAAWIDQMAFSANPDRMAADPMTVGRFAADGTQLARIADDTGMRRLGRGPTPFSPHFAGIVTGNILLHGDGLRALLHRRSPSGAPSEPLQLDLPRRSLGDAWAAYASIADSAAVARFDEIRDAPGLDSVPVFSTLVADDEGRVWTKAYDPETDSHWSGRPRTGGSWLVAEPDGTIVARVAVPDRFRLVDVRGDLAAGVTLDELGVERVEVRRLVRSDGQ